MSAFMVEDKTINRVVTWIAQEVLRNEWFKDKVEKATGIDTTKPNWEEELGKAMFQLNIDGVNERYGEGEAKRFRKLHYLYTPAYCTRIQVLRSMQCWLYQCAEGEVFKRPLYQFFDMIFANYLMRNIIYDLPEYQRAEWG